MTKTFSKFTVTALCVGSLLTACTTTGSGSSVRKQDVGTILGAIGGGAAGSTLGKGKGKYVAIATGTLLGAALGNQIGASLDRADLAYYNQASQNALETGKTGESVSWRNPDSGSSGQITPTRTYQKAGRYCREYSQTIIVGGESVQGYGTACRGEDGHWEIVS